MRRTCDGSRERLHEIGRIQSCGYLFAVEEGEGYASGIGILCASANIAEAQWINATSHEELPGKDLYQVLQPECVGAVRSLIDRHKQAPEPSADHIYPKANRLTADIYCRSRKAHVGGPQPEADESSELVTFALAGSNPGVYLVEMELECGPRSARAERSCEQLQLADLLTCIPTDSDPKSTTGALCERLVQMMPAYDRGMVYRFAHDGSGHVIHETRKASTEIGSSYLDFRFPATDIPPQARELFKQVGVRFIADTHAPGVPINFSSERGSTLDLSKCALRAPSECHLRYLRNMGVKASMVVAISVKGELWGLFVFHNYKNPVHPSYEERIMVETAAAITAGLIEHHERKEGFMGALSLWRTLEKISKHTRLDDFLAAEHRDLLKILDTDSIILYERLRSVTVYGNKDVTLTLEECEDLRSGKEDGSDSGLQFQPLTAGCGRLGAAFFSVRSFLVVFLRGSVSRHVKWAGDPDLPLNNEEPMHPRASFELFMEIAVADFTPWSPGTVELLKLVRHGITSQLNADCLPADVQETFAHVSHELRIPFHGVMGALEVLSAGSGTMGVDEQMEIIGSALRCGGSMMGTLNDILDVVKDRKKSEVAQGLFSASRLVQVAVAALSPFAATEGIELIHDADTGVPDDALPIVGDEKRIKAIVLNLINNAIKFTPRGGKVRAFLVVRDSLQDLVDWWTKETERFGESVWTGSQESESRARELEPPRAPKWHVFCVEDSGIGVLPADLPHLVTTYKQVSHGLPKSHPGTGLGLHICRAHVAAMSGALGIASTFSEEAKGGGTLFAVVLPLCPAEPASAPQAEKAAVVVGVQGGTKGAGGAGAGSRCPEIGSRKIAFLVVDDNSVNVKLISHMIRTYFKSGSGDVRVLSAASGVEAINKHAAIQTAQLDPDAPVLAGIFVDYFMPEMDGIEFTKRIRLLEAEKGWPRSPIYGCTANATVDRCCAFKDAGANGVLPKPWVSAQLQGFCNVMVAHVLNVERK